MQAYNGILDKLAQFTKRYYTKMLIKGILLFLAIGLLFFLVTLSVEYFLWLDTAGRMILFFCFLGIAMVLAYIYIFTPLFFLFKVKKGLSNKDASLLIGKHFVEVEDRLFNLLELTEEKKQSELLLASIEQRSIDLGPVPFEIAIDYKDNLKYIKYLLIPLGLFVGIWATGELGSFFNSYDRVVHYQMAYEPPAPFRFEVFKGSMNVLQGESYTISLTTAGDVRPEVVNIVVNEKELMLRKDGNYYEYTFSKPSEDVEFYFVSGEVRSKNYYLKVLKAPLIRDFELVLDYPNYLNRLSETLKSTGNAIIPEGTKVTWNLSGDNTNLINLIASDTIFDFIDVGSNKFRLSKEVLSSYDYSIVTSNENVKNYEKLEYSFKVIKDEFPTIEIKQVLDSLNPNVSYYFGEASDDYGLSRVQLVCYPNENEKDIQVIEVSRPITNYEKVEYTFPSGLNLDSDIDYSFYFLATDNDAIHNGKTSKSKVFSSVLLNEEALLKKEMNAQREILGNMNNSLEKFKEQQDELNEINKTQREKDQLSFNEQKRIKDFLKRQQEQEGLMQKFAQQLKEKLNSSKEDSITNNLLQERLERQELEARKNEKLLEELNKIAEKIDKEELAKKLDELGKQQQNNKRSLEQLLELTKRYYVTEKTAQLAKDLKKMGERQDILSDLNLEENLSKKEQETLNVKFENLSEELDELRKDNENLKKPLDLKIDDTKINSVKEDQQEALEEMNKQHDSEESMQGEENWDNEEKVKQKQKSAAHKMKEMAEALEASKSLGGNSSGISEDAEMLRQILDNLITFSFKQEKLLETLENTDVEVSGYSSTVKKQNELRALFEHVDDSLFALSLRRAELSEFVNEQITEVYYNIDKSLESLTEKRMFQGVSFQKYVLKASNSMADFLANILDNMQMSMQSGEGSGNNDRGFQLPDIIKGQSQLGEKMDGMGKSGENGEEGKGKEGNEGSGNGSKNGESPETGQDKSGDSYEGNGKNGNQGDGNNGRGGNENGTDGGPNEEELSEIYEIYKEQQRLRQELEQQLLDMINADDRRLGEKLVKQMEDFENDLLENGITTRSQNKMNAIEHELMKLENATLEQGKKEERESNTNVSTFQNTVRTRPSVLDNYRNEIEILNRQALPLRQNFQNKVKEYFKNDD